VASEKNGSRTVGLKKGLKKTKREQCLQRKQNITLRGLYLNKMSISKDVYDNLNKHYVGITIITLSFIYLVY
jgi:hypothetical protein